MGLFERIAVPICKATAETKRVWFRELLLHAALTPSRDPKWEEAQLAGELIEQIEAPGLEVLGELHRRIGNSNLQAVVLFDNPPTLALWQDDDSEPTNAYQLSFESAVVQEWLRRLGELRVINYQQPVRRKMAKRDSYKNPMHGGDKVRFTELGQLLVRWGMENDS